MGGENGKAVDCEPLQRTGSSQRDLSPRTTLVRGFLTESRHVALEKWDRGIGSPCGVYEDLTSAISVGFIAWLDLGLAVSLRHDVLVVLAAGVLHQLRVRLEYEGIVNVHGRT